MSTIPNEALRKHATSIGFALTLSKAQLELLVLLDHFGGYDELSSAALRPSMFVPTIRALNDRGLTEMQRGRCGYITRAGQIVCDLLREAGMYSEVLEHKGISEVAA